MIKLSFSRKIHVKSNLNNFLRKKTKKLNLDNSLNCQIFLSFAPLILELILYLHCSYRKLLKMLIILINPLEQRN